MPSKRSTAPGDDAQAVELRARLRGLAPAQAAMMRQIMRLHAAGDRVMFAQNLMLLAAQAPDHPEVQTWLGVMHGEHGDWDQAVQALAQAAAQRADEFRIWNLLGAAQGQGLDALAARQSFQRAASCATNAGDWLQLSIQCDRQGFYDEALQAVDAALRLAPQSAVALLQRSRCHKALGHAAEAAADCRRLIAMDRETARAWFALVDLKTVSLSEAERRQLEATAQRPGLPAAERQLLDFALGQVLEDAGEYERALEVFARANLAARMASPWQGDAFVRRVQDIRAAFDDPSLAQAPAQGREVIFLVGMPRSGSTLIEQVLAAHPDIEGASELPCLGQVIAEESRRRGRPFPAWVAQASAADWARLGQDYLRLSARWREHKPIATDKLPDNWLYIGAIRAMLPDARIIDCRRDLLETCWSCYKQPFAPGLASFSYDFDSLALYAQTCAASVDRWAQRAPRHVRLQSYEALVNAPEAQIRELLAFCGLSFDAACLDFPHAQRAIRTPSALQVRQPMRQASLRAARFGALLDPLRKALAHARDVVSS